MADYPIPGLQQWAAPLKAYIDTTAEVAAEQALDQFVEEADAEIGDTTQGLGAAIANRYQPIPRDLISTLRPPYVVSHRGGGAIDAFTQRYGEMTKEGFAESAAAGFLMEADARVLKDGTLVACHDATVDRTMVNADGSPATGTLANMTVAQWRALRVKPAIAGGALGTPLTYGTGNPDDDALLLFGGRGVLVIEVKELPSVASLVTAIHQRGLALSTVLISATRDTCITLARAGLQAMWQTATAATEADIVAAGAAGVRWVQCPIAVATKAYVDLCHANQILVTPYTTNSPVQAAGAYANGADGIITDDPWWLTGRYQRRDTGLWALGRRWAGSYVTGTTPAISIQQGRLRMLGPTGSTHMRQGEFEPRLPYVEVTGTLTFGPQAAAQDTFASIALGRLQSGASYLDSKVTGQDAYNFLIRRNGLLQVYVRPDNADSVKIAEVSSPVIAAAGASGSVPFRVRITGASVSVERTDTGAIATAADTSFRHPANISLGRSATDVEWGADFRVRDIPA